MATRTEGEREAVATIRAAQLFREGVVHPVPVEREDIRRPTSDAELLWIDAALDPGRPDDLASLAEVMGIGPALARLPGDARPWIRFRENVLVILVRAVVQRGDETGSVPLLLVAAPNMVASVHRERLGYLEEPIEVYAADPRFGRLDAGTFTGFLLDGIIDGYLAAVEEVEHAIDELDRRALDDRDVDPVLDDLLAVRARIATLRRTIAPHREVFAALARPNEQDRPSKVGWPWPGLLDRLDRALDAVANAREQLVGTYDIVSTRTGERTNDVMRLLTVVSAVLLPAVVIAGIMGMNFQVPFFDDPGNFLIVVGAMAALAIASLALARWRGWL
jgi:Mg2+ and Co2+ transporter CorA